MGAPTVYKDTDTDAPVLTGDAGSLMELLEDILVTGYGAKADLNWTTLYKSTGDSVAVFQRNNVNASDPMLYIDNSDGYRALVQMITTWDSGNPETRTIVGSFYWKIHTSNGTGDISDPRTWTVVGDELGFFIHIQYDIQSVYRSAYYFGDYEQYTPADGLNCFLGGDVDGNYTSTFPNSAMGSSAGEKCVASSAAGSPAQTSAVFWLPERGFDSVSSNYTGIGGGSGSFFPASQTAGGGSIFYPVYLLDSSKQLRGRLRGIYLPLMSTFSGSYASVFGSKTLQRYDVYYSTLPGRLAVEEAGDWDV